MQRGADRTLAADLPEAIEVGGKLHPAPVGDEAVDHERLAEDAAEVPPHGARDAPPLGLALLRQGEGKMFQRPRVTGGERHQNAENRPHRGGRHFRWEQPENGTERSDRRILQPVHHRHPPRLRGMSAVGRVPVHGKRRAMRQAPPSGT